MAIVDNTERVKQQYSDGRGLSERIDFHSKHSTNKQGFANWLWEQQYVFFDGCRILELGCGNGKQWEGRIDSIPNGCEIVLSDLSEEMVDLVNGKYGDRSKLSFRQMDIQAIDYPDETFDIIIANHMLYHVPDLSKALSEVRRVLKVGGKFYASTNGNGGLRAFLREAFLHFNPDTKAMKEEWSFSLQNGQELLSSHFDNVIRIDYEDSFSITETQDLIGWIKSTMSLAGTSEREIDCLTDYFEELRIRDGAIKIPKEAGLFISTKLHE